MFDIQYYFEGAKVSLIYTAIYFAIGIVGTIIFFACKGHKKIKNKINVVMAFVLYIFLVAIVSSNTIPHYFKIKKDIDKGSNPIESIGVVNNRIRGTYTIDNVNYYYVGKIEVPEYNGEIVKFSYYENSRCIYSIELYDEEEENA